MCDLGMISACKNASKTIHDDAAKNNHMMITEEHEKEIYSLTNDCFDLS